MTHNDVTVLPDGRRLYSDGHTYTPVPREQRKNRVLRPEDPRAVRRGNRWYLPLPVIPMEQREMPQTRPDDETLRHRALCRCTVCVRPASKELWRIALRRGSLPPRD